MTQNELRQILRHEGRIAARAHVLCTPGWGLMALGSIEIAVNYQTGQQVILGMLTPGNVDNSPTR